MTQIENKKIYQFVVSTVPIPEGVIQAIWNVSANNASEAKGTAVTQLDKIMIEQKTGSWSLRLVAEWDKANFLKGLGVNTLIINEPKEEVEEIKKPTNYDEIAMLLKDNGYRVSKIKNKK